MLELDRIYLGNCLELMREILDEKVDLVITDPPWFISQNVIIHRSMNPVKYKLDEDTLEGFDGERYKYTGKDINLFFGDWDVFENEEEYKEFTRKWFTEVVRVTKDGGHIISFFDVMRGTYLVDLAREMGCLPRQVLAWLKTNPVPRARCVDFMVSLEHAFWFTKETKSRNIATFNYQLGQQKNIVEAPIPGHTTWQDGERVHPCQKPLKVIKTWVLYLSNSGDLVIDPFAGSGTTCVAAKILNRKYIGIEVDKGYYAVALKRLGGVTVDMFEIRNGAES